MIYQAEQLPSKSN